jgi:gluconolactonase
MLRAMPIVALLALATISSDIIEPGATLKNLGTGYAFTEGPTPDAKGNVYFTDQPNDRIMRWNLDGTITEWKKPAGRSNGLAFDHKGNLIACADGQNELWSIKPDGTVEVILKDHDGRLMNGPNDVWVRPDNGLYFTDPLYARPYWSRDKKMQQSGQYVYFLSADRKQFRPVATDLTQPNGIVGAKDGATLYVADIGANKTYRYKVAKDGSLTDKTLFCSLGSDGMALDERGNLYLTGRGVTVFDKDGKQIEHIDVPEGWTANVTFGGADRKLLFITASKSIYGLRMKVKGTE